MPTVSADEIGGLEEALRHLREHGHARIALIAEDLAFEPTRDKVEAYRRLSAELASVRTTCWRWTSARPSRTASARPSAS